MSGERLSEEARWRDLPKCKKRDLKEEIVCPVSVVLCPVLLYRVLGREWVCREDRCCCCCSFWRRAQTAVSQTHASSINNLSKTCLSIRTSSWKEGLHAIRAGDSGNGITREKRQKARKKRTGGVYRDRQGGGGRTGQRLILYMVRRERRQLAGDGREGKMTGTGGKLSRQEGAGTIGGMVV